MFNPGPVFTKLFGFRIKIRLKSKHPLLLIVLKPTQWFNYWLFVFNQICTPDKTSRNYRRFYERKSKFNSCDRYGNL